MVSTWTSLDMTSGGGRPVHGRVALILTVKLRRLFERPYTVTGAVANCENS